MEQPNWKYGKEIQSSSHFKTKILKSKIKIFLKMTFFNTIALKKLTRRNIDW